MLTVFSALLGTTDSGYEPNTGKELDPQQTMSNREYAFTGPLG